MKSDVSNQALIVRTGKRALRESGMSFERLLCQPRQALKFCDSVRRAMASSDLSDFDILWTLLNKRKSSKKRQKVMA